MAKNITQVSGVDLEGFKLIIGQIVAEELQKVAYFNNGVEKISPKELLTRQETAEYLGVSLTTLHNWKVAGKLYPKKIGRKSFYPRESIMNLINHGE